MGPRYLKGGFEFDRGFGFTGSATQSSTPQMAKGGAIKKHSTKPSPHKYMKPRMPKGRSTSGKNSETVPRAVAALAVKKAAEVGVMAGMKGAGAASAGGGPDMMAPGGAPMGAGAPPEGMPMNAPPPDMAAPPPAGAAPMGMKKGGHLSAKKRG